MSFFAGNSTPLLRTRPDGWETWDKVRQRPPPMSCQVADRGCWTVIGPMGDLGVCDDELTGVETGWDLVVASFGRENGNAKLIKVSYG